MALAIVAGVSAISYAAIGSSDHDFSGSGWSGGEICIVCHTPHEADITVGEAPLWNHTLTSTVFQLYTSTTLQATVGQPDGVSKLCLSCHDGTIGLDQFGGQAGVPTIIGAGGLVGTDLRDDHPISITYDATLASDDGALYDPTSQTSGLGGTVDADMLFSNKVQCASCHDVHNGSGFPKLLIKSNAGSALCLTCHSK